MPQHCSITLQFSDKRTIRWIFQYYHDFRLLSQYILPWAIPDAHQVEYSTEPVDFLVVVFPSNLDLLIEEGNGRTLFILSAEVEHRYQSISNAIAIVSGPQPNDDPSRYRYGPTLCCWAPPLIRSTKQKICSTVENGNYSWRNAEVFAAQSKIPGMDIFGKLGNRPLNGYHGLGAGEIGNDKYLAIEGHAFCIGIERAIADDYITEKLTDAIMCESVPIYKGAPNVYEYCIPESFIPFEAIDSVDWLNWKSLYYSMRPSLLRQKELLRARFNVFSYFNILTQNLSLLDYSRPITISRPG